MNYDLIMAPRIVDKEQKRLALIQAAVFIFAAKGFQSATMSEIAARAGVGKGTLYEYFHNKEDLFFAVFEWFGNSTFEQAQQAVKDVNTAGDQLLALARASIASMSEYRELFPLTLEFWAASSAQITRERFASALQSLYQSYRRTIALLVHAGQQHGEFRSSVDAEAVATMLVGAMDGLFLQHWFDPNLDPSAISEHFFEPLLRGLRNTDWEESL